MAQFETWIKTDLQQPVKFTDIHGMVFTQDNMANRIGVEVYDGRSAADLSGIVLGYIIRADNTTVVVDGSLSGNKVWVDLPESAYAVPGQIQIAIRLVSGTTKSVLAACIGYVTRSATDIIIDPGNVVPDLTELLAVIGRCEQAATAANTAAENIGNESSELKSAFENDISNLNLRLDRFYPVFTLGALDINNGNEANATNRMRTGFIPAKNAVVLVALEYRVYVIYYDKYRQFVANSGDWVSGVVNIDQTYPYFRLLISNNNINNFTGQTENRTIVTIETTAQSVDARVNTLQSYVGGYYFDIVVAMMNVANGGINFTPVNRATSEILSGKYRYITAANGYSYYLVYYNSSLAFVKNSGGWLSGENELENYPYFRVLIKNDSISNWTGINNTFCFLEVEKGYRQHIYTIGQNDNVAQVLTDAMKNRGSIVYIEPYEHDCIAEWQSFYGNNYFSSMSSGEGLGLYNDIHIIGRSGHKLKCWYTGSNSYVMEHFSLFNNPHGGSGYTLENVCIDTKKVRYCVHDERGSDAVPYKVHFKHCFMSQDQTGSTWDRSRACIGGGVGKSADVVIEDCIFNTVTSAVHLDSLAYHNSDVSGAQSNIVIKNCYCAGNSTIQLMHNGASAKKTPVLVANCSMGSAMEIITNTGSSENFEIYQVNNVVRNE